MGGPGSGRRRVLSDAEKKANGSYKPQHSQAAIEARAAARVVTGPWLSSVREPSLPLGEHGRKEYFHLARMLYEQGNLTEATERLALQYGVLVDSQHASYERGKVPSASSVKSARGILDDLRIAERAPVIAAPADKQSKFKRTGFSLRAFKTI